MRKVKLSTMPKAVFIAPHTLGYAAGFIAVGVVVLLCLPGGPGDTPVPETAARGGGIVLLGLVGAALFSLGSAWAGVEKLPRPSWAFAAGVVTGMGLLALRMLSDSPSLPTALPGIERQGYYSGISTAYLLLAPTIAGFLSAWLWKRAR